MGSIFDIPSGLLFVLSLVTTSPTDLATTATGLAAPKSATALELKDAPCRHGKQAWFAALNQGAGGVAFSALAGRIFQTSGGRFYVPVAQYRDQILKLQHDNAISCFIALSSAANNAHRLKRDLGRDATLTDLYIAHVFGADHAVRVLKAVAQTPKKRMSRLFPALDTIEPGVYAGRNKVMTVGRFAKRMQAAVQRQVYRASGKAQGRTANQRRRPKQSQLASQRVKALVQKASISARDLLKRGSQMDMHAMTPIGAGRVVERFSFGAGLVKTLPALKSAASKNSIAF